MGKCVFLSCVVWRVFCCAISQDSAKSTEHSPVAVLASDGVDNYKLHTKTLGSTNYRLFTYHAVSRTKREAAACFCGCQKFQKKQI